MKELLYNDYARLPAEKEKALAARYCDTVEELVRHASPQSLPWSLTINSHLAVQYAAVRHPFPLQLAAVRPVLMPYAIASQALAERSASARTGCASSPLWLQYSCWGASKSNPMGSVERSDGNMGSVSATRSSGLERPAVLSTHDAQLLCGCHKRQCLLSQMYLHCLSLQLPADASRLKLWVRAHAALTSLLGML